jgi:hypothetical protein
MFLLLESSVFISFHFIFFFFVASFSQAADLVAPSLEENPGDSESDLQFIAVPVQRALSPAPERGQEEEGVEAKGRERG